jgi:type IV secretion system protein TrbL
LADVPIDGALDQIQYLFRNSASNWTPILFYYANRVFWLLALIDFVWMAIILALHQGTFSDWVASLIRKILFIGFFYALLLYGTDWANAIIRSLVRAGAAANAAAGGVAAISPSTIFELGFNMCVSISEQLTAFRPVESTGLIICGIVIMVCYGLISAMMLLIYVQSYVMVYAGVIFLGMGGSLFTKDIALVYLKAALSVGAKLFVMILIVGLGQSILNSWLADFHISLQQILIFIGGSIVLLALVKGVPDLVGDLINGFSWGAGDSLFRTAAVAAKIAAGTMAGAIAGGVGGTMAVSEAAKLAKTSSGASFASKVMGTATNIGKAAARDTAGKLAGQHWGQGTKGGRMAANMKTERLSSAQSQGQDYGEKQQEGSVQFEKDD